MVDKRKSVRSYIAGKTIPKKDIDKILQTVSLAPSAKNLQSCKIFVADNYTSVNKIFPCFFNQRPDFIKNAAVILVFCTNPKQAEEYFGERGKTLYALQDATIAATYAVLAATALGYASCWVGNFKEDEMQKALNTDLRPIAAIIIGYSQENPERQPRKPLNILAEIIKQNNFPHPAS